LNRVMKILAANRLVDGIVVYLTANGTWTEHITDASKISDEKNEAAALDIGVQAEIACEVVAPYLVDVASGGNAVRPTRLRELIREDGPTVRRDLGRQSYRKAS